jgi:uncharacterized Zn-binding protein involved in type VI secretion
MPQVARQGDTCDHDGAAIGVEGQGINSTVQVNGKPVAIAGTGQGSDTPCGLYKPSIPQHLIGAAGAMSGPIDGSPTVFAGGVPVHRFNDARGCGAETITASPNVWADFVDKIRIEGATVNKPKASPAAVTSYDYPPFEFYMFQQSNNGVFYIPKKGKENQLFTYQVIGDENNPGTQYSIVWDNFEEWGDSIPASLEFEEVTDLDQFKVPDVDFARRMEEIPANIQDIRESNVTDVIFAGGLKAKAFPSFGEVPIENIGTITGEVTDQDFITFFDYWRVPEEVNTSNYLIRKKFTGYKFRVANESGGGVGTVKLVTVPNLSNPF